MKGLVWTTFNGKKISIEDVDHQHLSNVYWYQTICCKNMILASRIHEVIDRRFEGKLLPYVPHPKFEQEFNYLRDDGRLVTVYDMNGNELYYQITDGNTGEHDDYGDPIKVIIGYLFRDEKSYVEYFIKREIGL